MNKIYTVSPSPHVQTSDSTQKIMFRVIIALVPALIWSVFVFGFSAVRVTAIAVLACVAFEYIIQKYIMKQEPTISDGSAILTGLLLAFNVPSTLPGWIIVIGALAAIGIGKLSYGGLGANIFNPALIGRVFIFISFPVQMTNWPSLSSVDGVSSATPLQIIKQSFSNGVPISDITQQLPDAQNLFLGLMSGSMGEISALLLIAGGIYMLIRKVITWHIPVSILATVFIISGVYWLIDSSIYINPVYHLLTGGLMLGAIYMATDMVSSPMTPKAQIIYGIGIGLITISIRMFGSYPEGISFAILIMNGLTPLLNHYIKPKRFGDVRKKPAILKN